MTPGDQRAVQASAGGVPEGHGTPRPTTTRRNEQSRRATLEATAGLVTEVGYARLTIEAIASRAGVSKQTIYRWWPSKGAVVFDALLFVQQQGTDDTGLPDTGDLRTDLKTLLLTIAAELSDPRLDAIYRAVLVEIQGDTALAGELEARLIGPLFAATRDRLQLAADAGQLDSSIDLDLAVELLYGPLFHRWQLRRAPLTPAHVEALADLTLRALGPEVRDAIVPTAPTPARKRNRH